MIHSPTTTWRLRTPLTPLAGLLAVLVSLASCGGDEEMPVAPQTTPPPPPLEPNELPTAGFTISVDLGQTPLVVTFDASSSSDPDGTLVSYAWKFGDGGTGTGVRPTHTYREPGMYRVDLTVRDDRDGEASARDEVVAFSPAGTGPNVIHGTVWFDRDMDEAMDDDERTLEGFAVFLDEDGDGAYDNGERFTLSGPDGRYELAGLDPDQTHTVSQVLQFGWSSTFVGQAAPPSGASPAGTAAIVNGDDADIEDFPFQIALMIPGTNFQFCGGTLINSRYVLTAAHCVFGRSANDMEVLLGSGDLTSGGERVAVQAIRNHPEFGETIDYDIAILRLEGSHLYPRVYVQHPDEPDYSAPGDTATAIGWGQTGTGRDGEDTNILKRTAMPIITNDRCSRVAGFQFGNITERVICAGEERLGRGVCFGDSGGPLLVPYEESWMEVGVTSFAVNRDECGNIPAAFARVTALYDYILASARIEDSLSYEVDWSGGATVRVDFGNFH